MCSIVDPCILVTPAFRLRKDIFADAIQKGLTYIFYTCLKFEFRSIVIKLKG